MCDSFKYQQYLSVGPPTQGARGSMAATASVWNREQTQVYLGGERSTDCFKLKWDFRCASVCVCECFLFKFVEIFPIYLEFSLNSLIYSLSVVFDSLMNFLKTQSTYLFLLALILVTSCHLKSVFACAGGNLLPE